MPGWAAIICDFGIVLLERFQIAVFNRVRDNDCSRLQITQLGKIKENNRDAPIFLVFGYLSVSSWFRFFCSHKEMYPTLITILIKFYNNNTQCMIEGRDCRGYDCLFILETNYLSPNKIDLSVAANGRFSIISVSKLK